MTNYKELDLLNSTSYQKKAAEVFITQSMKHFRRDIKLTEIIFATGNKDKCVRFVRLWRIVMYILYP